MENNTVNLRYPYAYDEQGNLVSAETISKEDRLKHEYFIEGLLEDGTTGKEKVTVSIGNKYRNHFKKYPVTSKKYTGQRVSVNIREYNETVIHKIAKQLFEDSTIKRVWLPAVYVSMPGNPIKVRESECFSISKCKTEVLDKNKETQEKVVYDVVVYNEFNESLVIEIYVTHKVDLEKREKIERLGRNAIEIDLSDLIQSDKIVTSDIADKIKSRIVYGGQPLGIKKPIWINNIEENRIHSWFNSLVDQPVTPTRFNYERDGRWYFWAADVKGRLKRCPYHDKLDPLSEEGINRMLTETRCKNCERCVSIEYSPVESKGKLICNQSDVSNAEMLRLLASYRVGIK